MKLIIEPYIQNNTTVNTVPRVKFWQEHPQ